MSLTTSMELLAARPKWAKDSDYSHCTRCFMSFSTFTRRHHCRMCGQLLCAACAPHFLPVPELAFFEPVRLCVGCAPTVPPPAPAARVQPSPLQTTPRDVIVARVGPDANALQGVNFMLFQGTSSSARSLAAELLRAGADVYVGAADLAFGRQVGKLIVQMATTSIASAVDTLAVHERLHVVQLDPTSLASVRQFAADFIALNVPLDALVLNCQTLAPSELQRTADGLEVTLQTSFLAGFLLVNLLEECLCAAPVARVLVATSAAHSFCEFQLDDLNGAAAYASSFGPWRQFAAVASMNLSFASALDWHYRLLKGCNVFANSIATGVAPLEAAPDPTAFGLSLARRHLLEPTPSMCSAALWARGLLDEALPTGRYYVNGVPTEPEDLAVLSPVLGRRLWARAAALCKLAGGAAVPPHAGQSPPSSPAVAASLRRRARPIDEDDDDDEADDDATSL
jgi:NAD(P)-dependent dehydrogenase (short-subunit alcohol dehydrogenase family)